jgi:aspartyl-tRNA(Asn)/glutamyl-tRNA(Gln) amidotransferase subunit A
MSLHELTACSAVELMQRRELSPVEYVRALLDRISATEPSVQAWVMLDEQAALRRAEELERLGPGDRAGLPLYGIPTGLKDVIHVRGFPTGADFVPFETKLAPYDSAAAERLRRAGAVVLGKTVTTPFAFSYDTPKTRNPWNLDHTPGGSSSGTPAAVAARHVPIAIGTQTMGSGLRPSAYCGVVGLKATLGRISTYGVLPTSWSSDHVTISAREVRDAALALAVLAKHDARDPRSLPDPSDDVRDAIDDRPRTVRLAKLTEFFERASDEVREAAEQAVDNLVRSGATVVERRLPAPFDFLLAIQWIIQSAEGAAIHAQLHANYADNYRPNVRANVEIAMLVPAALYLHALRHRRRLRPPMLDLLSDVDGLIAPTAPDLPPRRNTERRLGDSKFQAIWSAFGFPNISLPTGIGHEGLPRAIQVIGAPTREYQLLQLAAWCEAALGRIPAPPI